MTIKSAPMKRTMVVNVCAVVNLIFTILLCVFLLSAAVRNTPCYSNLLGIDLRVGWSLCVIFILLSIQFVVFFRQLRSKRWNGFLQIGMLTSLLFFIPYVPSEFIGWYKQKKEQLREVVFQEELVVSPIIQDDGSIVYRVNKGIIRFSDGGWVYVDAHARKKEAKREDPFSQDFALAVDDKKTIYRFDHRFFGDLEIHSESKEGIADIHHFLQLRNWEEER